jgi:hypothetical protein
LFVPIYAGGVSNKVNGSIDLARGRGVAS